MTSDQIKAFLAETQESNKQYFYDQVLRKQGYIPGLVPEAEQPGYGFAGGIWEGLKRGAQQTVEDVPGGLRDIPEGIKAALNAPTEEQYQAMTPWERLKGIGGQVAGVGQAALGPFRTVFAPLSGVTRAVSEIPYLWGESPGEARSPERELPRLSGQIALDALSGIGLPKAISVVRSILKARGIAPAAEAAIDMTRGRLLTGAGPEVRPLALPEPGPGVLPPVGPPPPIPQPYPPTVGKTAVTVEDMLTGKTLRGTQKIPLTDSIEEVRRGLPVQEIPPGRTPHEAGPEIESAIAGQKQGETIGQTMRRLRREKNPNLVDDITEGVPAGPAGKPYDMSLRDWVKLNKRGAGEAVEAVVNATDPAVAASAPPHIQAAAESIKPTTPFSDLMSRIAPWSKNLAWYLRKVQSPEFVTRNDPIAAKIVSFLTEKERQREFLNSGLVRKLVDIRDEFGGGNIKAGNAELKRIVDMRDNRILPTNQLDAQRLKRIAPLFDEAGQLIGITPDHPLYVQDYVARMRQNVVAEKTRLIQVKDYIAHDIKQLVPGELKPFFTKTRKVDIPGERHDIDYLANWLRGVSRASIYGTPQHHGALQDLGPMLNQLSKSSPEMQEYVAKLINYTIGAPNTRSTAEVTGMANLIRNLEYTRTIGFNPMSAFYNTLQRIPTFVETSAKSWLQGVRDEIAFYRGDKGIRELVTKAKIDPESFGRSKLGLDELAEVESKLERGVVKLRDWSSFMFGPSEKGNRLHAFFSGYRDGISRGLNETEALQRGVQVMEKTQFGLGRVGRAEAFRSEPGGLLGQYKSFPIKMLEYTYRNAEDVVRGLQTAVKSGDRAQLMEASRKFAKLWGAQYALGGAAVIPVIGHQLEKIDPTHWKGALPTVLGMAIGEQLGIGVLDLKDFESLRFWLPGPAVNHILETAQGLQGLAGVDLSSVGLGKAPTPSETARYLTRSAPVGGVVLERLRRAGLMSPTGEEREPRTLGQAFGGLVGQPPPRTQPLIRKSESELPRLQRAVGVVPFAREQEATAFSNEEQARTIKDTTVRAAQQAWDSGDVNEAHRILRHGEKQLESVLGGQGHLKLTPQSKAAAQRAAKSPVLQRMRQASGQQIGSFREDTIE